MNHTPNPLLRQFNLAKRVKCLDRLIEKAEHDIPLDFKDYQLLRKWGVVKEKKELCRS